MQCSKCNVFPTTFSIDKMLFFLPLLVQIRNQNLKGKRQVEDEEPKIG